MTITERLMAPGAFTISLKEECDLAIRRKIVEFGHIVITPTPINLASAADTTMLGTVARYVGVIHGHQNTNDITGAGLAWWLGAEDGVGPLFETAITKTAATMSAWVTDLVPAAIATGTLTNTSLSTLTWSCPKFITSRQAIDYVCAATGAEWRVRNNATLDVALGSTLFRTATPDDIVIRKEGGPDLAVNGLHVDNLTEGLDASNYTTKVLAVGQGDGSSTIVATATNSTAYKDLRGNAFVQERVVDSPSTSDATAAAAVAQSVVNQYAAPTRPISLSTDTYDIGRYLIPGDYLYVYDLPTGLYDATGATQVIYRGQTMTPTKLRVLSYTWPVEEGMGVYYRDLNGVYTELTQWVDFEAGAVNYEVGDLIRIQSPNVDATFASPVVARTITSLRYGCTLSRAATQNIATATSTAVSWDTELADTGGFYPGSGTTVTVPSGLDGLYSITGTMDVSAAGATTALDLNINGSPWHGILNAFGDGTTTAIIPLAAGFTITVTAYQSSGSTQTMTARLDVYRIGD